MADKCKTYQKINFTKNAKHTISLQSATETVDEYGGYEKSYSELASMRAIIEPMSQSEAFRYSGQNSEVTHKIHVRYQSIFADPLTTAKYRIVFSSRTFEITEAINLFEDNKFVKIMANEVNIGDGDIGVSFSNLLLENNSAILLENGSNLLLEG